MGELRKKSISIPEKVPNLERVVKVSAGYDYTLALTDDGTVWEWGRINMGLKQGEFNQIPVQIQGLKDIKEISAGNGGYHLALKTDGTVWIWGNSWYDNMETTKIKKG